MRNPLKKLFKDRGFKDRGCPDSCHVHDGNSSSSSAVVPSSAPPAPSSALSLPPTRPPLPAGYPSTNNPHYMAQTPTAYPYNAPQQDSEQVWEIDTGNNTNLKGSQKAANVRAANSAAGSPPAINLPRSGKFVINTGGNTNHGDVQESGNVDFANVG